MEFIKYLPILHIRLSASPYENFEKARVPAFVNTKNNIDANAIIALNIKPFVVFFLPCSFTIIPSARLEQTLKKINK